VHGVCGGEKNVVTAAAATEATTTNERRMECFITIEQQSAEVIWQKA